MTNSCWLFRLIVVNPFEFCVQLLASELEKPLALPEFAFIEPPDKDPSKRQRDRFNFAIPIYTK